MRWRSPCGRGCTAACAARWSLITRCALITGSAWCARCPRITRCTRSTRCARFPLRSNLSADRATDGLPTVEELAGNAPLPRIKRSAMTLPPMAMAHPHTGSGPSLRVSAPFTSISLMPHRLEFRLAQCLPRIADRRGAFLPGREIVLQRL